MTTKELKNNIYQLIDSFQNDATLLEIHRVIKLVVEQQDLPLDNDLTQSSLHRNPKSDK